MGQYRVDAVARPGIVMLCIQGALSTEDMREFVREHNGAIEALKGAPYRVFCDLREALPLSPEAAQLFQSAKSFSAMQLNFHGSAVLVQSSVVAMQHRRTSVDGGVMQTELITDDETACWEHLRRVTRPRRG